VKWHVLIQQSLYARSCSSLVPPFVVATVLPPYINSQISPCFHLNTAQQSTKQHCCTILPTTAIMESTKTAEKAQEICPRCTEPASKQCGGCKGIAYCSLECQQADWPSHKSMCKAFAAFAGPRPSVNMRRVVVFIPGEDKPRFKWAPLNEDDLRDGNGEHIHPSRVVETPEYVTWGSVKGVTNVWTGAPLGYNIQVWHDDDFMEKYQHDGVDGKALRAATQGMDAATWRGPVMACCGSVIQTLADLQAGHPPEDTLMLDMDLRAYSHLTGIMIDCYNETLLHAFHRVPGKVQCVEMACGQGNNSTEVHKLVQVPRTHPMFQGKSQLSEVSKVCFSFVLSRLRRMNH
jgi:hypothetical protein